MYNEHLIQLSQQSIDRRIRIRRSEGGQAALFGLIFIVALVLAAFSVLNVGLMVSERVRVQNAVDAAAYSSAVAEARYLNLAAYVNRAMIANYNSMAFNFAAWSSTDAIDHGSAAAVGIIYTIATVLAWDPVAETIHSVGKGWDSGVHKPMHAFNRVLKEMFGDKDRNMYIEQYNTDILSIYQGVLFAAAQGVRPHVAQAIASKIDPDVDTKTVLSMAVETANFDELSQSVDYVFKKPNRKSSALTHLNRVFDSMAGNGHEREAPLLLGAAAEASLDRFTAGRTREGKKDLLRNINTGNLLHGHGINIFVDTIWLACEAGEKAYEAATLGFDSYSCPKHFSLSLGSKQRWGSEDSIFQQHVPILSQKRVREVNSFGLDMDVQIRISKGSWINFGKLLGGVPDHGGEVTFGYTSGTSDIDIQNYRNLVERGHRYRECHRLDWIDKDKPWENFFQYSCYAPSTNMCELNKINACLAEKFFALPANHSRTVDVHWDGNFSQTAASGTDVVFGELDNPPLVGCDSAIYQEHLEARRSAQSVHRHTLVQIENKVGKRRLPKLYTSSPTVAASRLK